MNEYDAIEKALYPVLSAQRHVYDDTSTHSFSSVTHTTVDCGPIGRIGDWLSRDPIGEMGGVNVYAFVNNKPTYRIDRLGLFDLSDWIGPGGVIFLPLICVKSTSNPPSSPWVGNGTLEADGTCSCQASRTKYLKIKFTKCCGGGSTTASRTEYHPGNWISMFRENVNWAPENLTTYGDLTKCQAYCAGGYLSTF